MALLLTSLNSPLLRIFIARLVKAYGEIPENVGIEDREEGGEEGVVNFGEDSEEEDIDLDAL